jgi:hypothetical protein
MFISLQSHVNERSHVSVSYFSLHLFYRHQTELFSFLFQFHIFHSIYSIGIKQNCFHSKNGKSTARSIESVMGETIPKRTGQRWGWRREMVAEAEGGARGGGAVVALSGGLAPMVTVTLYVELGFWGLGLATT